MTAIYQQAVKAAEFLKSKTEIVPRVVLVLGSGLGDYAERLEKADVVPYEEIPFFPRSTVEGHKARLIFGELFGVPVAMMQGRFHYYEGYTQQQITLPIRALRAMGAEILFLTNASGGICHTFTPGDLMMIDDHINFSGTSPLIGENVAEQGMRFPDMSQAYDRELKQCLLTASKMCGVPLKRGVYMMFNGPQFETPAEIRFSRCIGADAAGMSTVPEVIVGRHCGMRVCGVSCITNMAAGMLDQPLTHTEVMETGEKVKGAFAALVDAFLQQIGRA